MTWFHDGNVTHSDMFYESYIDTIDSLHSCSRGKIASSAIYAKLYD